MAGDEDTVRSAARSMLDRLTSDTTLEATWLRAAAQSLLQGSIVDPDIDLLKQQSSPVRAWHEIDDISIEGIDSRVASLFSCHHLATAIGDEGWLINLQSVWDDAPEIVAELTRLRASGEIGLGLAPRGTRPFGWTPDEIEWLEEEHFLVEDSPRDVAWRALAGRDIKRAVSAIHDYALRLPSLDEVVSDSLRQIWVFPGACLGAERRALESLADRFAQLQV